MSSTDSTWIESWCIPGIITSAGTESILKLGQELQLAPKILESSDQGLSYFFWPHTHIYTPKNFCFCELHQPRITQLLQRQYLFLGDKPPNRQQGWLSSPFLPILDMPIEQHTIRTSSKAKTHLTHPPPIPLTTDELLTKQTLHSACWERSSQVGCRLTHGGGHCTQVPLDKKPGPHHRTLCRKKQRNLQNLLVNERDGQYCSLLSAVRTAPSVS